MAKAMTKMIMPNRRPRSLGKLRMSTTRKAVSPPTKMPNPNHNGLRAAGGMASIFGKPTINLL